jgi:hypothetical protein
MSKVLKSTDSNGHTNTLVLQDADLAVLDLLKSKRTGEVKLTISAASAKGDTIFITHKNRIYEFQRKDVFK